MGLLNRNRERTVMAGGRLLVGSNLTDDERYELASEDAAILEADRPTIVAQVTDSAQTVASALIDFLRGKGAK